MIPSVSRLKVRTGDLYRTKRLLRSFGFPNFSKEIPHSYAFMSSKLQILLTRRDVPEDVLSFLRKSCEVDLWMGDGPIPRDELLRRIVGKNGLLCLVTEKIDEEVLNAAGGTLQVISSFSVGLDHLDIDSIKKRNIRIGHTPGVLTDAVAELTITLLLAASRRIFEAHNEILNGGWSRSCLSPLWMCGKELRNSVVGIAGMGRIGFGVLERLQSFKIAKALYTARSEKVHANAIGAEKVSFDELLEKSDFVICCLSLSPEVSGLFDSSAFKKMKNSAIFVNVSRGGLVVQEDLIQALKTGEIHAAGLDVMTPEPLGSDHELLKLDNCTVIPHIGSATYTTRLAMGMLAAENLLAGLQGSKMPAEYA